MKKKILIVVGAVMALMIIGVTIYINDYYHAEETAQQCITQPSEAITVIDNEDVIIFEPQDPEAGIIFYPGGKVEAESYAPLMKALAERGFLSIIVRMPGNLAVLDIDAAEGITEQYKGIDKWYMAGHSLGGSMAASYIGNNAGDFHGLILLAAYSTEDLSNTSLKVISVYGENDKVLNMEKYKENLANLPKDFTQVIIPGGNHAYFGAYGEQEGDGTAEITQEEQIVITADIIKSFIQDIEK